MLRPTVSRLLPVLLAAASVPAMGLSIRDDRTFAQYETQVNTAPYSAAGQFNNSQSGTLINSTWVLGCAHVGTPTTFTASDGTTASVIQSIYFPGSVSASNATSGNDFALFQLAAPINTVPTASLHDPVATGVSYTDLLTQIDGLTAVYTTSGETGTGDVGVPLAQTGTRDILAGTNIIDSVGTDFGDGVISNVALSDFDDPNAVGPPSGVTNLEMGLVNRDSGGGLWVDLGNGEGPVLIGVHSLVSDPDGDEIFGEYGQLNISTVLTPDAYNWINATVPEPTSLALLLTGGLMVMRRRRP
ncbi:MAG: trypsin-like serine protease [Phycisphaeraceae bacterium]|nr:trypsin-like serine protease [Phycisphaeraceae bacterium]